MLPHPVHTLATAAAMIALLATGTVLPASAAHADAAMSASSPSPSPDEPTPAADSGDVTWAVRPADETGADGRSWVEWEADPGQVRTEHLIVFNYGQREVQFRLSAADGYFTDTGRFSMLPSDRPSTEAGTWISLPESVSVPAGGSVVVAFTISVPDDATPGDHPAGVAASILSRGDGTVGVESRVGFRVMTRVTGELVTQVAAEVTGSFTGSLNPFEPGTLEISYAITNTGNTRLRTVPMISIAGPLGIGASTREGEQIEEIAPGETRTGAVRVASSWPVFWYDVSVSAEPEAVTDELAVAGAVGATSRSTVLALPWSQAATLAAAAALLILALVQRRRDRARTARLIAEAREEGRGEAAAATGSPDPVDPPLRRSSRHAARVIAALLIGLTATSVATLAGSTDAHASGIAVDVEITPTPGPTHSPTPSPTPTATPLPSPGSSPGEADTPALPQTGGGIEPALLLGGGVLLATGTALAIAARLARRRS